MTNKPNTEKQYFFFLLPHAESKSKNILVMADVTAQRIKLPLGKPTSHTGVGILATLLQIQLLSNVNGKQQRATHGRPIPNT